MLLVLRAPPTRGHISSRFVLAPPRESPHGRRCVRAGLPAAPRSGCELRGDVRLDRDPHSITHRTRVSTTCVGTCKVPVGKAYSERPITAVCGKHNAMVALLVPWCVLLVLPVQVQVVHLQPVRAWILRMCRALSPACVTIHDGRGPPRGACPVPEVLDAIMGKDWCSCNELTS